MKIKYLGNIRVSKSGKVITKRYGNTQQGSAFKKIPCDIIVMANEGFKMIVIECEETDKYIQDYRNLIGMTSILLPNDVKVQLRILPVGK